MQSGGQNLLRMLTGENPKYSDVGALLAGPLFTDLAKGSKLFLESSISGVQELTDADTTYDAGAKFDRSFSKLSQWALRQVPGQNLWYTKQIYSLAFLDGLHEFMDPEGYRRRQYHIQKDAKNRMNGEAYNPLGEYIREQGFAGN